jgi:hypothetical protein
MVSVVVPVAAATAVDANVPVAREEATWLLTATPTYTVGAIRIVSDPTVVQLRPSADFAAVIVLPVLVSFSE